jgi:dienelactone hydrolase
MRLRLPCLLLAAALVAPAAAFGAGPPAQPKTGPGGADYVATDVTKRAVGTATSATFVFHAAGPAAEPRPVVVLLHAWGAVNPQIYGGLIDHLARKGYLVLWPRFQEVGKTRPADATANAVTLVKEAFAALADDPAARPDPARVAVIGHSAGAAIAANIAALAKTEGLPVPKLVLGLMPGGVATDAKSRGILLADLGQIDPGTILITMSPDRDHLPADRTGRRILKEAANVPVERKVFMRALSDGHGYPAFSATLASPGAFNDAYDAAKITIAPDPKGDPRAERMRRQKWSADMVLTGEQTVLVQQLANNGTDTLDWYGYWKTIELAASAAFAGKDGQALRNDPALTDMGRWSDGWPVKRLVAEAPRPDAAAPASTGAATSAKPGTPAPSARNPGPRRR